tara:strand:- start:654 stop:860 length:207 start_codon:yes stop_codon:yes gene_type:complete
LSSNETGNPFAGRNATRMFRVAAGQNFRFVRQRPAAAARKGALRGWLQDLFKGPRPGGPTEGGDDVVD